jgi:ABC-type sugar transport system substrate-binding protein
MDGRLGVFVFDRKVEYHRRMAVEAEQAARREGLDIRVFDSDNNAAKQAQDLVKFATDVPAGMRACALVVPLSDASDQGDIASDPTFRVARRVLQKGVGWITLNHGREDLVTALRREFPALPVAMSVVDNVDFGRIQAHQLRALLPKGGAVLAVQGNPFDSASRGRSAGLKEALAGSGITLAEVDGRWDAALAESAVAKWILSPLRRQSPLQAVASQNDEMGAGARRALVRAASELSRPELAKLPVLGGDGLEDRGRRWVDQGELTATVSVTIPGRSAVELLAKHWREAAPLPAVMRLPSSSYPALGNLRPAS